MFYLDPAVIDEDLQHRDVLAARLQVRQVVQRRVNGSVCPVLKLPAQVTHLIVFDFSPNDVLENLQYTKGENTVFYCNTIDTIDY